MAFTKAERNQLKLKMSISGPPGSGKTKTALEIACSLGGRVALIDCEGGSSNIYANEYDFDNDQIGAPFTPEKYIEKINEAVSAGYDSLVIDGITPEWTGDGGCNAIQQSLGGGYNDWRTVTPRHNAFIKEILNSDINVICTMRVKNDVVQEKNKRGKMVPVNLGLKVEQRNDVEYEFYVSIRVDANHMITQSKDRSGVFHGEPKPISNELITQLVAWLNDGESMYINDEQQAIIEQTVIAKGYPSISDEMLGFFGVTSVSKINRNNFDWVMGEVQGWVEVQQAPQQQAQNNEQQQSQTVISATAQPLQHLQSAEFLNR